MTCPKCGSKNVLEMDNLNSLWACGDCGYTDDGAEFDEDLNALTYVVGLGIDLPLGAIL